MFTQQYSGFSRQRTSIKLTHLIQKYFIDPSSQYDLVVANGGIMVKNKINSNTNQFKSGKTSKTALFSKIFSTKQNKLKIVNQKTNLSPMKARKQQKTSSKEQKRQRANKVNIIQSKIAQKLKTWNAHNQQLQIESKLKQFQALPLNNNQKLHSDNIAGMSFKPQQKPEKLDQKIQSRFSSKIISKNIVQLKQQNLKNDFAVLGKSDLPNSGINDAKLAKQQSLNRNYQENDDRNEDNQYIQSYQKINNPYSGIEDQPKKQPRYTQSKSMSFYIEDNDQHDNQAKQNQQPKLNEKSKIQPNITMSIDLQKMIKFSNTSNTILKQCNQTVVMDGLSSKIMKNGQQKQVNNICTDINQQRMEKSLKMEKNDIGNTRQFDKEKNMDTKCNQNKTSYFKAAESHIFQTPLGDSKISYTPKYSIQFDLSLDRIVY